MRKLEKLIKSLSKQYDVNIKISERTRAIKIIKNNEVFGRIRYEDENSLLWILQNTIQNHIERALTKWKTKEKYKAKEKGTLLKFAKFVAEVRCEFIKRGVPLDTVKFVGAVNYRLPYYDKRKVTFTKEYPEEFKERVLRIIQEKYDKMLRTSLHNFYEAISNVPIPTEEK